MRKGNSILWRRLESPGHEHCRLDLRGDSPRVSGTAVLLHEGMPCRLAYTVTCDAGWRTLAAKVEGWLGERPIDLEITVDEARRWRLDGAAQPELDGCDDIDLSFSPSTNTLPIRRLRLAVGEEAPARAAFLPLSSFVPEPLEQIYRRLGPTAYHYQSADGEFVRELEVNEVGLVVCYPGLFEAEGWSFD